MSNALDRVKLLHTVIWAFFAASILAIPGLGGVGRYGYAAVLAGIVFMEVLVLAFNGGRCPLTGIAERYTDDRRDNFDIYLPEWLARHNKLIFGVLYLAGMLWTGALWAGWTPAGSLIDALGLIGVAVFAISGGLAAGRKGLDWVGVVSLGTVTALGGGTLRDLLLDRDEIFWIGDTSYLWVAIVSSVLTIFGFHHIGSPNTALRTADALGLALFTVLGAQIAELEGASPLVVVIMAVLTGVAGGAIRDTLASEIPLVFRSTETLYSVAALGGVLAYLAAQELGFPRAPASLSGVAAAAGIRFAAIFWDLRLPAFHVSEEASDRPERR
jgi:uncharacterized membrane protein YeiH